MRLSAWQKGALCASLFFAGGSLAGEGTLSENLRISSAVLGYDLQYRVYQPASTSPDDGLPTLYVTDGQSYLAHGDFKSVLDEAIANGLIRPVLVVFLDSRNPDNLAENRRNAQFMCSENFAVFFASELIPEISLRQPVSLSREDRVILGFSFGALNSACFGLFLPDVFGGIAMQSPGSSDHVDVVRRSYEKSDPLPLKAFLSAGTRNDNLSAIKQFRRTLEKKGYDLTYITVREGHDWRNWGPLLDDVLVTFFGEQE